MPGEVSFLILTNSILRLKVLRRWLFPVAACLWIVWLLGGCSTEEAVSRSKQTHAISAETKQALQQLSESSEKLYRAMKSNDTMLARAQLEGIARQLPSLSLEGIVHAESLEVIYAALGEARRTFNAVQFDPQLGLREAAKIRLLCDALSQPKHPMWRTYYKPMEDNANRIYQAAAEQQSPMLHAAYEELAARYAMIKPSLAVAHPAQMLVKADSMIAYLQPRVQQSPPAYEEVMAIHTELLQLLREMFGRDASSTDIPVHAPLLPIHPVLYWGAAIGSFILTVLAFVGYRRYHYEKERPPSVRQKPDQDG